MYTRGEKKSEKEKRRRCEFFGLGLCSFGLRLWLGRGRKRGVGAPETRYCSLNLVRMNCISSSLSHRSPRHYLIA